METLDAVVVGAGVVGLAVARALALAGREVVVLEAETQFGMHASSRNSEVIHAGIHYAQHSLKARSCVAGKGLLYRYCAERGIAHRRIGKLLVATGSAEVPALMHCRALAMANGVDDLRLLEPAEWRELEPAVEAVAALLSPSTGIVDSHAFMSSLLADLQAAGGMLVCNSPVTGGRPTVEGLQLRVGSEDAWVRCNTVVNCAGLRAPRLALAIGVPSCHVPVPRFARGHYFALRGPSPFRRLVYPVPEAGGLGIHVTLDLAGNARFGPDVQWLDDVDYGFAEDREPIFRRAISRYFPGIAGHRIEASHCGVRARIGDAREPAADFRIDGPERHGIPGMVNLFGIESPGLTASLALADIVSVLAAD